MTIREVTTTLRAYCRCGATAVAESTDADVAQGIIDAFRTWHTGGSHGPATARQAAAARRRNEAAVPS